MSSNSESTSTDSIPTFVDLKVNESTSQAKASGSVFNWFGTSQAATPPASTPPVKTSTTVTDIYYGTQRVIGGKSATSIFHNKYNNGMLEGDLKNQPTSATNDLNNAMNQRIMRKDPNDIENQNKTAAIFIVTEELSTKTGIKFALAPTSAAHFKRKLQSDITTMTQNAADELDRINMEYTTSADAAAVNKYKKIQILLDLGKCTASNHNKLHIMSQENDDFLLTETVNYDNLDTYQAHLRVNASETANPQAIFEHQASLNNKQIDALITQLRNSHGAMASVIRNKRKHSHPYTPANEFDKTIDEQYFQSNASYLNLLAGIEAKKNKTK